MLEFSAQEFGNLVEALREHGLVIPDEADDVHGLIIALRANPVRGRPRGIVPLRPRIVEADGGDPDPAAEVPYSA